MKFKHLITLLIISFSLNAYSQLSGSYTIGSSGNYSSFSAAASALNNLGISGNVVFNVSPGTYTENFTINNFTGNSNYTVVFQSVGLDSSTVILQYVSGTSSTNNFVVKLNQAKNIRFAHMRIQRTGSNNYSQVIDISNSSSLITFNHVSLQNNNQSLADDFASILVAKNTNLSSVSDIYLTNCKLINGSYGVYIQGESSGNLSQGTQISDCFFGNQYRTAIYLAYQHSPVIVSNTINSNSSYSSFRVIDLLYCNYATEVLKNKIQFNTGSGLFYTSSQGQSFTGKIFNNFIAATGNNATAIYLANSGTHNLYFNSINLSGNNSNALNVSGSTSNHLRFANNILYSANANKLIIVGSTTILPFDYCNYNNYKTTGLIGDWKSTTNISTLSAWKTASSLDASTISVNPNFVSNTDLHIQSSGAQRMGTSMLNAPTTTEDIDSTIRHNMQPDMGAHEYSTDDLAVAKLSLSKNMCVGNQYAVMITIKNHSNYPLTITNVPVTFSFNNTQVSELKSFSSLASGDSIDYVFTGKIQSNSPASFKITAWIAFNSDDNSTNDTLSDSVFVYSYPQINLPLDTNVCKNNVVTLDAGPGFDKYLWSTQDTSQTVTLSVSQLGLGGTFVSVKVWRADCSGKDSTLVIFKDCSGLDDILSDENIKIFPVPAANFINISLLGDLRIKEISVSDLSGRNLIQTDKTKIDISALQRGAYILILKTEKGIIRKTFIKN